MTIEVESLRRAINVLLDHLEAGGKASIELGEDYYWNIDEAQLYDVAGNPVDLSIGSLCDDWESIQRVGNGATVPVVLLLLKVAPLLRYIGSSVTEADLVEPSSESGPG